MITVSSTETDKLYDEIASKTFEILELDGAANVELEFMNEEDMRALNSRTRSIDKTTDVLSYPNLDVIKPFTKQNYPFDFDEEIKAVFLGSIVICKQVAERQAEEYGHSVLRERAYLFLHGLLHLLGYDHIEDDDKKSMRSREEQILSSLGVER